MPSVNREEKKLYLGIPNHAIVGSKPIAFAFRAKRFRFDGTQSAEWVLGRRSRKNAKVDASPVAKAGRAFLIEPSRSLILDFLLLCLS